MFLSNDKKVQGPQKQVEGPQKQVEGPQKQVGGPHASRGPHFGHPCITYTIQYLN